MVEPNAASTSSSPPPAVTAPARSPVRMAAALPAGQADGSSVAASRPADAGSPAHGRRCGLRGLIRLARPADWTKNLFVFPALIASGTATNGTAVLHAVVAFVAFCFTASGVYALNDVIDRRTDALHPVKRERPIPSGAIRPATATVTGVVSLLIGLALGPLLFDLPQLTFVLLAYLALQAAYTGGLKRVAVLDVSMLAFGFVLRAFAGAVVIDKPASLWMLATVFFLCLYLAQIKRLCDLRSAERAAGSSSARMSLVPGETAAEPAGDRGLTGWRSPAGYRSAQELNVPLGLSAALAVGTLLAYALSDHASRVVGPGALAFAALTPLAVVVIGRFYRRANEGRSDSPLSIALSDPVLLGCAILFAVGAVVAVYVPAIGLLFEQYFVVPRGP